MCHSRHHHHCHHARGPTGVGRRPYGGMYRNDRGYGYDSYDDEDYDYNRYGRTGYGVEYGYGYGRGYDDGYGNDYLGGRRRGHRRHHFDDGRRSNGGGPIGLIIGGIVSMVKQYQGHKESQRQVAATTDTETPEVADRDGVSATAGQELEDLSRPDDTVTPPGYEREWQTRVGQGKGDSDSRRRLEDQNNPLDTPPSYQAAISQN